MVFPCGLEMLKFSSCYPKFFAVRNIHYPVNTSSDHSHTDAVVPSSDHCRTQAVLPPSGHYCIETVPPSGDHYCMDIVVPSSDHCCIDIVVPSGDHCCTRAVDNALNVIEQRSDVIHGKVAPPSDHLHTKSLGGHGPVSPSPLATQLTVFLCGPFEHSCKQDKYFDFRLD